MQILLNKAANILRIYTEFDIFKLLTSHQLSKHYSMSTIKPCQTCQRWRKAPWSITRSYKVSLYPPYHIIVFVLMNNLWVIVQDLNEPSSHLFIWYINIMAKTSNFVYRLLLETKALKSSPVNRMICAVQMEIGTSYVINIMLSWRHIALWQKCHHGKVTSIAFFLKYLRKTSTEKWGLVEIMDSTSRNKVN